MRPAPRYSKLYNFIMSNFFCPKTESPSASPAIGCIGDWRESCPGVSELSEPRHEPPPPPCQPGRKPRPALIPAARLVSGRTRQPEPGVVCLGNQHGCAENTLAPPGCASIVASLPFLVCLEGPQQLLGKQRAHLREMGDDLCVGQALVGCKLEQLDHVLGRTGRGHEFQRRLGSGLYEATPVFSGHVG